MSKLTDYIEKELKKGFSSDKVKQTLLKYKYPENEVNEALKEVQSAEFPQHRWKKPVFWEIFGVIVAVILVMLLLFFPSQKEIEKEINKVVVPQCDNLLPAERDVCVLKLAAQQNDTAICGVIGDLSKQIDCYQQVWANDQCRYEELVGEDADECYMEKALKTINFNFCLKTKNPQNCLEQLFVIKKDKSVCLINNNIYNQGCINYLINSTNDASLCTFTDNQSCRYTIALNTKNKELCNLDNKRMSFYCKFALTNDRTEKESLIKEYQQQIIDKKGENGVIENDFIFEIAIKEKDSSYCSLTTNILIDKIESLEDKSPTNLCKLLFVRATQNINICQSLKNNKDSAVCNLIAESNCKDSELEICKI